MSVKTLAYLNCYD